MPWTTLSLISAGSLLLIVLIWWGWRTARNQGKTETRLESSEQSRQEMADDAEIAARPYPKRPLGKLLGKD
jgi:hypothetical protein